MAKDNDLTWVNIDPTTLAPEQQRLYDTLRETRRLAAIARTAFEEGVNKAMADAGALPAGSRMVFGYNFGKLSAAITADDRKPKKAANPALSLDAWLVRETASGARV